MKKLLVTGAGGFLGRHLCGLLRMEYNVIGVDVPGTEPVRGIAWRTVEEEEDLALLTDEIRPELVIHAAFVNRKPETWTDSQYLQQIIGVNIPLFEVIARSGGKLLLVSSSAVYGRGESNDLIDETCPVRPTSLYGVGKTFQEVGAQYYSKMGLKVCIARVFNLSGPGQKPGMVLSDWVRKARAVARGELDEIRVKHRKTSRDFIDVRDVTRALILMAENFRDGEIFNVASGQAVSLLEIGRELEELCGRPLRIVETDSKLGSSDVQSQKGSFEKLRSVHGWSPSVDWRRSLRDLWDSYEW